MRHYPKDEYDLNDLEALKVEPWMTELLKLNPSYCSWGPHEDYMCGDGSGWNSKMIYDSWKGNSLDLNDLNEVANFYFSLRRDGHNCPDCDGSGQNPATHRIAEDFYDFANTGRRWCDNITQDEVQALVDEGRLRDFTSEFVPGKGWQNTGKVPTAEEVNAANRRGGRGAGLGHDAINRWILIKARAKRLGVYGHCEKCDGGTVYDEDRGHVALTLWVLHPRKGASRGWEYSRIEQDDLPEIFAFLRQAAERNAERFSRIPKPLDDIDEALEQSGAAIS